MRTLTYEGAARAGGPPEARATAGARIMAGMLAGAVAASRNSCTKSEDASSNRKINSIRCYTRYQITNRDISSCPWTPTH